MGAERVLRHELVGHLQRELVVEAAADVDRRQLLALGRRVLVRVRGARG